MPSITTPSRTVSSTSSHHDGAVARVLVIGPEQDSPIVRFATGACGAELIDRGRMTLPEAKALLDALAGALSFHGSVWVEVDTQAVQRELEDPTASTCPRCGHYDDRD